VIDQPAFDLALMKNIHRVHEVDQVWIFGRLLRQIRVLWRQRCLEVGDRLTRPLVQLMVDLQVQDTTAPPVLEGLLDVPQARFDAGQPLQQDDLVAPRQVCNSLLQNLRICPGLGKGAHVPQVPRRVPLHAGEALPQVGREPVDHPMTVTLGLLPLEDVATDAPVRQDHLTVGRDHRRGAPRAHPLDDGSQQIPVPARHEAPPRRRGQRDLGLGVLRHSPVDAHTFVTQQSSPHP
jgi:hypothetical protein